MYYLSRIEIDTGNRQKISDLSHLGAYHSWVENSFPQEINSKIRKRHLWRIDYLNNKEYLLVLSEDKPNLDQLASYGIRQTAEVKEYSGFLAKINDKELFQFRITANPTHKVSVPGEKSRVFPHITIEQQKKWFLEKAKKNGFAVPSDNDGNYQFDVVNRDWPYLYHKNIRRVKLSRVSFEGILKVTDKSKFLQALCQGIGREKAYGMGLLTVIPLRRDNE